MPSNHLILCHPLLFLPSIFPSIRVFSNESVLCIRWPKNWSFSFSISPSNEYSGLISFRIDLFNLLAVQRTLKSSHPEDTPVRSLRSCGIWMFSLKTVKLSSTWLEVFTWKQNVSFKMRRVVSSCPSLFKSLLVQQSGNLSGDLSPVYFGVQVQIGKLLEGLV